MPITSAKVGWECTFVHPFPTPSPAELPSEDEKEVVETTTPHIYPTFPILHPTPPHAPPFYRRFMPLLMHLHEDIPGVPLLHTPEHAQVSEGTLHATLTPSSPTALVSPLPPPLPPLTPLPDIISIVCVCFYPTPTPAGPPPWWPSWTGANSSFTCPTPWSALELVSPTPRPPR